MPERRSVGRGCTGSAHRFAVADTNKEESPQRPFAWAAAVKVQGDGVPLSSLMGPWETLKGCIEEGLDFMTEFY